jgi:predicted nucleotidyltransferase
MSPNRRARRERAARAASELQALAGTVAKWIDEVPGVPAVYLFGSRVRGDHRPDSDVDIRVYLRDWVSDSATAIWWLQQNQTDFSELKAQLPGPLSIHIHHEARDAADEAIKAGMSDPVLRVRKAVCVWTPHKTLQSSPTESNLPTQTDG